MNLAGRLASMGAMAAAGLVAPKIAASAWKLVTGEAPPEEDDGAKLGQVLAFAALSAVIVTTLQFYTTRGTNRLLGVTAAGQDSAEDSADGADATTA